MDGEIVREDDIPVRQGEAAPRQAGGATAAHHQTPSLIQSSTQAGQSSGILRGAQKSDNTPNEVVCPLQCHMLLQRHKPHHGESHDLLLLQTSEQHTLLQDEGRQPSTSA